MAEINDKNIEAITGGAGLPVSEGTPHDPIDPACSHIELIDPAGIALMDQTLKRRVDRTCVMCKNLGFGADGTTRVCKLGY